MCKVCKKQLTCGCYSIQKSVILHLFEENFKKMLGETYEPTNNEGVDLSLIVLNIFQKYNKCFKEFTDSRELEISLKSSLETVTSNFCGSSLNLKTFPLKLKVKNFIK